MDEEKEQLKQEERTLSLAIENDNVGRQIKDLEREIKGLESTKLSRQRKLEEYNKKVIVVGLDENPSNEKFNENREKAKMAKPIANRNWNLKMKNYDRQRIKRIR